MDHTKASTRWDELYRGVRCAQDPPIPFVKKILSTLETHSLLENTGLYIGCGNGRNYLPLVNSGLNLFGLDFSDVALRQLAAREPDVSDLLIHADFRGFHSCHLFNYIIAIQVFQHGFHADVASYFTKVRAILPTGGLFFLRVNSATTQIYRQHTISEQNRFGGKTIIYQAGPKQGLPIHFYSKQELTNLTGEGFEIVDELREVYTYRAPPEKGFWSQWEGIWRRPPPSSSFLRKQEPTAG